MQQKPSALIKPTLDTTYHIDYSWWDRSGEDLRTYLLSHLPPEQRERISQSTEEPRDRLHRPGNRRSHAAWTNCNWRSRLAAREPDFINPHTSVVDSIFRVFLANGNTPLTPKELGDAIGRSPTVILKTVSGARVYKGIRPVES